jgi:L-histidine N-alpha-methyltransferase
MSEDKMLTQTFTTNTRFDLIADIRLGLTKLGQKELPSKYLYDSVGSALFEVISILPEYGLTRADERLLKRHSNDIVARLRPPTTVAELGSGSGKKTRWMLEALSRHQHISYCPIEISRAALTMCERELGDIESVSILGFEREYLDGLLEVAARRRKGEQLLVLFLGSTIGNFEHPADVKFLHQMRGILEAGDALLLGTDLIKPIHQLLDAYDDPLGVTAAFNLNLLARINRELDADFVLKQFEHLAKFNPQAGGMEMHIRSRQNQTVTIPAARLSITFHEGETIWTESSHKYSLPEILQIAENAGFRTDAQWIDEQWPFAENLLIAA